VVGPKTPAQGNLARGQPKGRYESIVLVLFLCILLVVTIVNVMDYLARWETSLARRKPAE